MPVYINFGGECEVSVTQVNHVNTNVISLHLKLIDHKKFLALSPSASQVTTDTMTPRKPKPAEAKKPFAASGKITKPKATAQSAQLPTVHGKGVREYRNGTLNLEKTPEHLVAA